MAKSYPNASKHCGKRRNCMLPAFSSFPIVSYKRLVLQTRKNQGLFGKGLRNTAAENIVRKGEIACNKQLLLFSQCFLPYLTFMFHFKCTLKCRLQFVPIWTSLEFFRLVMG